MNQIPKNKNQKPKPFPLFTLCFLSRGSNILLSVLCIGGLLFAFSFLQAENYLDTLWTQYGEEPIGNGTNYGINMTAIDFNGDGIDDLIVEANNEFYSKFYFYLGWDDFDNIADYYIYKAYDDTASYRPRWLKNIGDFNGDNYDDIMLIWYYYIGYPPPVYRYSIQVYYCGPVFDLEPDFTYLIPYDGNEGGIMRRIGNINGDNCNDIGFILTIPGEEIEDNCNKMYIIYGDESTPIVEYFATVGTFHDSSGWYSYGIYDISNINNDSYDDFMVKYYDPDIGYTKNYLYYGGNPPDSLAYFSIEIYEASSGSFACGDYNNDGINDFIGDTWGSNKFWYGSEQQLFENPDLLLLAEYTDDGHGSGDLNNDGYSDIIMANSSYSLWDGKVYIFIGGNTNSVSYDLSLYTGNPEFDWFNGEFGKTVALGDFNNDGFDDLAVGAPDQDGHRIIHTPHYNGYGKVFVFAGNGELAETDSVDVDDDELVPASDVEFNVYPNPFNPSVTFEIKLTAKVAKDAEIQVFNIKGQKVETLNIKNLKLNNEEIVWNAENHASGVYYCKLVNVGTDDVLSVKKVTLLK